MVTQGFFFSSVSGISRTNFSLVITKQLTTFISKVKGKHSAGKKIPESSWERKKTVDIDILISFRNGGKHKDEELEPVQIVHMNIYQSNINREDLSWLEFDSETQQVLDQQSYISAGNNLSLAGVHVDQVPKVTDGHVKFLAVITFIEMSKQACHLPKLDEKGSFVF